MPVARFQMPDGRVARFQVPEGTTPEQAQSMIAAEVPKIASPPHAGEADDSSALANLGAGAVRGASRMGNVLLDVASAPVGLVFPDAVKEFKDWRRGGVDLMDEKHKGSAAYTVGDIGAQVAMTAPVGPVLGAGVKAISQAPKALQVANALASGGGGMMMRAGTGAATGAASMALTNPDDIVSGAVTGGLMPSVTAGLARVVKPQTDKVVKALMAEGVRFTPGQILGGGWKAAEEKARSIPIIGDAITAAHRRGVEDFNRPAINRALKPIGAAPAKAIGREGVEQAHAVVSRKYGTLLPKLGVIADDQFATEIASLKQMAASLPPDRAAQFDAILGNEVMARLTPAGRASGETAKAVDSALGRLSRAYGKSEVGDERLLGDGLRELQASFRRLLERSNPNHAGELAKLNTAYANLLRVENAAGRQGAKEGVFTPAQLGQATRAMDSSLRKRKTAHGEALMQDLSDAAQATIAQTVPDSGTAGRLLIGGGLLSSAAINPTPLALAAGGALAYTPQAQRVIQAMLTQRPAGATKAASIVRRLDRPLTVLAAPRD